MNTINVIHPYKYQGTWVFDDEAKGLVREAFVSGADQIIERAVADIPQADSGFTLVFSAIAFPGHRLAFERRHAEAGGYWYYSPDLDREGWLCPALFHYFEEAPERIYAQFRSRDRPV
jgi:hypothetical protein